MEITKPVIALSPVTKRTRKGMSRAFFASVLIISLLSAVASGGLIIYSAQAVQASEIQLKKAKVVSSERHMKQVEESQRAAAEAAVKAAANLKAERKANNDRVASADGFTPAGEDVYYRWADSKSYSCGYLDCAYLFILVSAPCPAGVYIAASIDQKGVSIGRTNAITAGLSVWGSATVKLNDSTNAQGAAFALTDVHCMG